MPGRDIHPVLARKIEQAKTREAENQAREAEEVANRRRLWLARFGRLAEWDEVRGLVEFVNAKRLGALETLATAKTQEDIFRAQGAVAAITEIGKDLAGLPAVAQRMRSEGPGEAPGR